MHQSDSPGTSPLVQPPYVSALGCVLVAVMTAIALPASAGPREQARRIHDRVAGVPPSAAVLDDMAALVAASNAQGAAELAMESNAFYDVTLKNFITPATNEEQTVFAPLNDYSAMVIGMVRDDVPFNTLLSADLLYVGASNLNLPAYSIGNNAHYEALEASGVPLQSALVATTQSALTGLPSAATAGVMTTRAAAEAFFYAGTNRAMFRFTMLNHMCLDLEQVRDPTRSAARIRQDVSRSPGGDSRIFLNNCVGCHAGMDPLAQAFAYYEYNIDSGELEYTADQVQPKYRINATTFKFGYETPDDRWDNLWRSGQNTAIGWDPALPGSGTGAKTLGDELANTEAFASCQATKVFRSVCLRSPVDGNDRDKVAAMSSSFMAGGYRLKQLFADAAVYCMGD